MAQHKYKEHTYIDRYMIHAEIGAPITGTYSLHMDSPIYCLKCI
jgi:hypothetical protein